MKIEHVYLINLDRRPDRLEKSKKQLDALGIEFERISAIDGQTLDIILPPQTDAKRWNKSAYALTQTTINILKDAEEKGYENILILEDDIVIHPLYDISIDSYLTEVNFKFDFLFLGYTIMGNPPKYFTSRWDKILSMCSCHAYIINKHMITPYRTLLEKLDNPIDYYVNVIVASRMNSFCAIPLGNKKLVWQESGISDIEGDGSGVQYNVQFTE